MTPTVLVDMTTADSAYTGNKRVNFLHQPIINKSVQLVWVPMEVGEFNACLKKIDFLHFHYMDNLHVRVSLAGTY